MAVNRFGPNFPRLFVAALFQELSFALLIHAPGYFSELGASEGRIGLLYSACALVSLLFRPLLGRILDLTHRRTVILVAAAGNVVVLFALAFTSVWGPALWGLFLFSERCSWRYSRRFSPTEPIRSRWSVGLKGWRSSDSPD